MAEDKKVEIEKYIILDSSGYKCALCGFTARSKKIVIHHLMEKHKDALKKKKKKMKDSEAFEPLLNKKVVVVSRRGLIYEGILEGESTTYLLLKDAVIKGKKYIAETGYLLIDKHIIAHIHSEPKIVKEVERSTS